MEDFVTFLVIIAVVIINALRLRNEQRAKNRPPEESGEEPPRKPASTLEDFFDELARKFEPQPRDLPEWPEEVERPDYIREMEEYEEEKKEFPVPVSTPKAAIPAKPEFNPTPITVPPITSEMLVPKAMGKAPAFKLNTQNMMMAGMSASHIANPPLLRSAAGKTHFGLKTRKELKQALIASMVFGSPRAYEQTFHNSLAE